jgi:hypothetical protein
MLCFQNLPFHVSQSAQYRTFPSKASVKGAPLQVPQQGPHEERCPFPELSVTYLPESPVEKVS